MGISITNSCHKQAPIGRRVVVEQYCVAIYSRHIGRSVDMTVHRLDHTPVDAAAERIPSDIDGHYRSLARVIKIRNVGASVYPISRAWYLYCILSLCYTVVSSGCSYI